MSRLSLPLVSRPVERAALPAHLYVHVPLCRSKCAYCDFCSVPDDGAISHADLVTSTVFAAVGWQRFGMEPAPLQSLYVGGGTPSVLGGYLRMLLTGIVRVYPLAPGAEVTVEANPESLDARLVCDLVAAGVTRVSLGVQSLDDGTLSWLGRAHDAERAIEAMLLVAASGLDLSVDLMCGLPRVPESRWRATLRSVVECGATHVSVYPLSVEDGTPLASRVRSGRAALPDDDIAAEEMIVAAEELSALGLARYETANHALPGKESRHNTAYWTGRPYLGIGAGAHGMLTGEQARLAGLLGEDKAAHTARVRYAYGSDRLLLDGACEVEVLETLDAAEALREDAMLGLRLSAGIPFELAERSGVVPALEALEADGLVERAGGRWRTTERGWLLGNEVFGRVLDADGTPPASPGGFDARSARVLSSSGTRQA